MTGEHRCVRACARFFTPVSFFLCSKLCMPMDVRMHVCTSVCSICRVVLQYARPQRPPAVAARRSLTRVTVAGPLCEQLVGGLWQGYFLVVRDKRRERSVASGGTPCTVFYFWSVDRAEERWSLWFSVMFSLPVACGDISHQQWPTGGGGRPARAETAGLEARVEFEDFRKHNMNVLERGRENKQSEVLKGADFVAAAPPPPPHAGHSLRSTGHHYRAHRVGELSQSSQRDCSSHAKL